MKKRNSSVEILRFLLMFFIVIWHSIVHGIGLTHIEKIPDFGINYFPQLIICIFTCICVDCFMFISGFYGIRFSWKGLMSIVFSCIFYSAITSSTSGVTPPLLNVLCPLSCYQWWFMSCYTIVFLLSGFIDKHIVSLDKRNFSKAMIASYIFLYLWHWIIGKTGGMPLGQPMLMITIYIMGRYCGKYGMPQLIDKHPVRTYILTLFIMVAIITFLLFQHSIPKSVIWFVYTNGSPLVIMASMAFFELFRRQTWYNKTVNYLSSSVLSIYLITDSPYIRGVFNQWLYGNYESNVAVYIIMILFVMILCVLADQIRRILFNKIYSLIEVVFK